MPFRNWAFAFGFAAGVAAIASTADAAVVHTYVDLSSYANNNVYTDLNQNFPNTGAGTPGSHTGVANATFLFTPWTYTPPAAAGTGVPYTGYSAPLGDNGVSFQLNSSAAGQDFVQIGNPGGGVYTGPNPETVSIGQDGVTAVYALMSSYTGQYVDVTFNEKNGGTVVFNNVFLPDFNGGSINTCGPSVCDQTVYTVADVGGGGTGNSSNGNNNTYDLTEVGFQLPGSLNINSVTFNSHGYETLLFGLTTQSVAAGVPEPSTWAMLLLGLAGLGGALRASRRADPAPV